MYGGRLLAVINCSHEVCMVVSRGVVSLGSFLSSVVDGGSNVALRVSNREVRKEADVLLGLSPFGSMAMMTLDGWICGV